MSPAAMPARKSAAMLSWATMPKRIMMIEGGISAPIVPATATMPVAKPGS